MERKTNGRQMIRTGFMRCFVTLKPSIAEYYTCRNLYLFLNLCFSNFVFQTYPYRIWNGLKHENRTKYEWQHKKSRKICFSFVYGRYEKKNRLKSSFSFLLLLLRACCGRIFAISYFPNKKQISKNRQNKSTTGSSFPCWFVN